MDNIIFLYGDEEFLIDEHYRKILKKFKYKDSGLEILEDASIYSIFNALSTKPMFTPEKMVVIKNTLSNSKKKKKNEITDEGGSNEEGAINITDEEKDSDKLTRGESKELHRLLSTLPANMIIIFIQTKKFDGRKEFFKVIKQYSKLYEYKAFASYDDGDVVKWISNRIKNYYKVNMSESDIILFQSIVGVSLRMIDTELQKLITYVGNKNIITTNDIKVISSPQGANVFLLLKNILKGDFKVLDILRELTDERAKDKTIYSHPLEVLAFLISQMRMCMMAKSLLVEARKNQDQITKEMRLKPGHIYHIANDTKHISLEKFLEIYNHLAIADLNIKTGKLKMELALELLCIEMIEIINRKT